MNIEPYAERIRANGAQFMAIQLELALTLIDIHEGATK